jgi:hypothetical protein
MHQQELEAQKPK